MSIDDFILFTGTGRDAYPSGSEVKLCYHTANADIFILVMQCFGVGFRGTCHASFVFSVYTRAFFRRVYTKKIQVTSGMFHGIPSESIALLYPIPKSSENLWGKFWKSSEISANFRKLWKGFKPVFEELKRFMKLLENFGNSSKVFSRCFYDFKNFRKIVGNRRKCSKIFGNFRKTSETVQK